MTGELVHWLEHLNPAQPEFKRWCIQVDADLFDWLLKHPLLSGDVLGLIDHWHGLVGDLTGVERLLARLHPGADWSLQRMPGLRTATLYVASLALPGMDGPPFAGIAPVRANALLAAALRAHEAQVAVPARAVEQAVFA